jgi:hypothetical protein
MRGGNGRRISWTILSKEKEGGRKGGREGYVQEEEEEEEEEWTCVCVRVKLF